MAARWRREGGVATTQHPVRLPYRWNDAPEPVDAITPADIREALMWTGHLDAVFKGELNDAVRKATQRLAEGEGEHEPPTSSTKSRPNS